MIVRKILTAFVCSLVLFGSAQASVMIRFLNTEKGVCKGLEGDWNGTAKATVYHTEQCTFRGVVHVKHINQYNYSFQVDVKTVKPGWFCHDMQLPLEGTCYNGEIKIENDYTRLVGRVVSSKPLSTELRSVEDTKELSNVTIDLVHG